MGHNGGGDAGQAGALPDEHTGEDRSNTGPEQGAVGGAPPPQQANMGLPGQHMLMAPGLQLFFCYLCWRYNLNSI